MLEHTLPIYVVHGDGDPIAHGTGVLLRIADVSFLLSCAHVLEKAQEEDALLLVPSEDGAPLVRLVGVDYRWTEDDRVDLGVALLPEDVVDLVPSSKKFLRLSDLELERAERAGVYSIVGYPVETTERSASNINSTPMSFTSFLHDKRVDNHVDGVTIALTLDANATGDSSGDLACMPHLKGMSGCGIWRLAAIDGPPPPNWSEKDVKLIGIEHGFVCANGRCVAIKGSHIAELLDMIRSEFPALRNSIDLKRA